MVGAKRRRRQSLAIEEPRIGRVTLSVSGSWEVTGSNVTLFEGATTTYTGTFTSTSMTLTTKTATVLGYTK